MRLTALDPLRTLLDHFDEGDRTHQLAFFRALHRAGPAAVQELAPRALRPTAPKGLRLLAVEAGYYHPWPDWAPVLTRLLRHESDFGIFSTGIEALGRIRTGEALEALRELSKIRAAPQFQGQIAEVLARTDPAEAFRFHMGRLLEGSRSPSVANEAAYRLADLVQGNSLAPLQAALGHPDLLIFRHALRLIAAIPTAEAARFLSDFLREAHLEVLEDRTFKAALGTFRGLAGPALREAVAARLDGPEAEALSENVRRFLMELQELARESKTARISARMAEAAEEIHLRARRLDFAVDAAAEGVATMVLRGHLPAEELLPLVEAALREQTGREGAARALARVVRPDDGDRLDLLLTHGDAGVRLAGLEVLGERREEALRPVLLRACRDAIYDHAQRALFHLGHLSAPDTLARELLSSLDPADRDLALRFITLHGLADLAPDLIEEAKHTEREDWQIQVLGALGALKAPGITPFLTELLHSGQSPRLQTALAEALRDLGDVAASEALCARAAALKVPQIHAIAVEAMARVHGSPASALQPEGFQGLHDQVLGAWDDRNPWPLRFRVVRALEGLHLASPSQWIAFAGLVQEALNEKRPPGAWTPAELARVQAAGREWTRRAG